MDLVQCKAHIPESITFSFSIFGFPSKGKSFFIEFNGLIIFTETIVSHALAIKGVTFSPPISYFSYNGEVFLMELDCLNVLTEATIGVAYVT